MVRLVSNGLCAQPGCANIGLRFDDLSPAWCRDHGPRCADCKVVLVWAEGNTCPSCALKRAAREARLIQAKADLLAAVKLWRKGAPHPTTLANERLAAAVDHVLELEATPT